MFRAGAYEEACQHFETAAKLDPGDVEVQNNLGFARLKLGRLDAAQSALETTLKMAPDRAGAWFNLGEVFSQAGDQKEAVEAFLITYRLSKNREQTLRYFDSCLAQYEEKRDLGNALKTANNSLDDIP